MIAHVKRYCVPPELFSLPEGARNALRYVFSKGEVVEALGHGVARRSHETRDQKTRNDG